MLWLLLALFVTKDAWAYPEFVFQPYSTYTTTGGTVTFYAVVTQLTNSSTPLSVMWRLNGANIPGTLITVTNVPTTITNAYTITNAQPANAGNYSAVAFDGDGAVESTNADLFFTDLSSLPVGDTFAFRGTIDGTNGTGTANNFSSTNEPGTPSNNNIPGGAMVWLEWIAPMTGVATFTTSGSDFDTTLGIYQFSNKLEYSITNLVQIIGDDDDGGYFTSAASFNVTNDDVYEIGIDGYYGIQGNIVLNWSEQTGGQIPVITQQPQSQTTILNASTLLSVTVNTTSNNPVVLYQWFFNGVPIYRATNSTYTIANVVPATVGQYRVQVQFADESNNFAIFSQTANVQINLQGNSFAEAQPKLHSIADTNNYPGGPVPLMAPVTGFSGTQIWNNYGSAEEEGVPSPCDQVGGTPYWFSIQPAYTGMIAVYSQTPTFDNVLNVYTWPGGNSYASLVSVACTSTNPGPGQEVVVAPVTSGTTYYIVVDGLGSTAGNEVYLSWTNAESLNISHLNNSVIVSWPNPGNSTPYILQTNPTITGASWTMMSSPSLYPYSNGTNSVTITPPVSNLFFRLAP